jgi:hypothetical protein
MALRVKDDIVQLEAIIGTNSAQTVAEGTVTIPSSMVAADRIVKVTAIPHITEQWVEEDRVNIDGVIAVTLIYAGQYDTGRAYYGNLEIADGVPFSHFVDIPGVLPNMQSQCDATILDLQPTVRSDGRTIDLDLVLELSATARESQELTLVTDATVSGSDKLKVAKDTLHIEDIIGKGTAQAEIHEMIPLSEGSASILRLLQLQGQFRTAEKRVAVDRAIVSGTISYKAVFAATDGDTGEEQIKVHRWDNISRVEFIAEIPGSRSGMVAYPQIAPPVISGRLLNEGQMLSVEGILAAVVKVVQPRDITVVSELSSDADMEVGVRFGLLVHIGNHILKNLIKGKTPFSWTNKILHRLTSITKVFWIVRHITFHFAQASRVITVIPFQTHQYSVSLLVSTTKSRGLKVSARCCGEMSQDRIISFSFALGIVSPRIEDRALVRVFRLWPKPALTTLQKRAGSTASIEYGLMVNLIMAESTSGGGMKTVGGTT